MSSKNMVRTLALLVLLAMFAAACGQKEGVHVGFAGSGGGGTTGAAALPEGETFEDADGDGVDDTSGITEEEFQVAAGGGDFGGDGGVPAAGGDTGGDPATGGGGAAPADGGGGGGGEAPAGTADGGGGGGDSGEGAAPAGPGDSTGVSDSTVKIGIHAPLTGAAPLPSSSFQAGKDQYWRSGNKIAGRNVEVVFRDDKYNPSSASQVCQELIQKEKVFLLVGAGGADQIAECARVAAANGVPYLSSGVTELRLNQMPTYWALSQSYAQQMTPLMQLIKADVPPSNKKVGLIAANTSNFDDAVAAFEKTAKGAGYTPVVYRPSKQASDGELAGVAQRMATDQVTVATPVMAPVQWIKLASNPSLRQVKWRGIGITMGLNTVATAACQSSGGSVNGSAFFSPWPGLNLADQLDKNFNGKGGGGDDIQWSLWGLNKTLHAAFLKMGDDLTRQAFNKAMTTGVSSGIYPNLKHTASDHFGIDEVHLLRLDCSARQFKSSPQEIFKKGF